MAMSVELYFKENIDEHAIIKRWPTISEFPVFLRDAYNFYEMTVLGMTSILLEVIDDMSGVETLKKHIRRVEMLTDRQAVLYYKKITRYRRKGLIENRVPFVIEDGQIYLPFLGLYLKKAPQYIDKEVKHFSVSAQLAYLYLLYHKNEVVNATEFAKKMSFTAMTASRALKDLYNANLTTYEIGGKTGRSKKYKRINDPEYFQKGHVYIKTPVRKVVYAVAEPVGALTAGLEALAQLSMINPPEHPVTAISIEYFNKQKIEVISNVDLIKDAKPVELQIWNYDPRKFSDEKHVDLLSLYASLKEENDERIEQALEKVLEGESWYTD
jgi:DNA-binding transcriptional ArsR family regulator